MAWAIRELLDLHRRLLGRMAITAEKIEEALELGAKARIRYPWDARSGRLSGGRTRCSHRRFRLWGSSSQDRDQSSSDKGQSSSDRGQSSSDRNS